MKEVNEELESQTPRWDGEGWIEPEEVLEIRDESPNNATSTDEDLTTFDKLSKGERFEFYKKTDIGCGKYNGVFTKTSYDAYRGQCFVGYPQPNVEVRRVNP